MTAKFVVIKWLKILGYVYNSEFDTMCIKMETLNLKAQTKRQILSSISKVFDPLGFLTPVIVNFKLIMKKIYKTNYHWDRTLPSEILKEWNSLACLFNDNVGTLKVPRFAIDLNSPLDLIVFCDASQEAYGVVIYAIQHGKSNLVL